MKKIVLSFLVCIFLTNTISGLMAGKATDASTNQLECKIVRIALLAQARVLDSNDARNFENEFTEYQWIAGNTKYIFNVTLLNDDDIFKGYLTTDNYDLLVVPGGSIGDGESFVRCFPTLRNFLWKRNIANFIRNGGGYYSVCGGTALITDLDLDRPPQSFAEYAYEKSGFGVTWVKSHYETIAFPFLCHFGGLPPEYIGVSAYVMLSGWNTSDYGIHRYSGVCFDCPIQKNNPIFDDYLENTRRIRWVGGPSLVIPENPDREVNVLAYYPALEMSENVSTQIHAWKYVGGIRGIRRAIFESLKNSDTSGFKGILGTIYAFLGDWEMTDKIIQTDFSNQPAMTAEIYPNEKQARILLTGLHPEYNTWWGGSIKEAKDTDTNNLWDALHRWVNVTKNNETLENEYNYWINRRCVSWVAKIPDNDLPPVYGPSQVSDIYPYEQASHFTIEGNSEIVNGNESLDLYYRYSSDNVSWESWTLYGKDSSGSDGWSWEFYAPNGPGCYQFYSIRRVNNETETSPPGPDAIAHITQN
jgi:glutamine amidotransferase-like uncharacterized protein